MYTYLIGTNEASKICWVTYPQYEAWSTWLASFICVWGESRNEASHVSTYVSPNTCVASLWMRRVTYPHMCRILIHNEWGESRNEASHVSTVSPNHCVATHMCRQIRVLLHSPDSLWMRRVTYPQYEARSRDQSVWMRCRLISRSSQDRMRCRSSHVCKYYTVYIYVMSLYICHESIYMSWVYIYVMSLYICHNTYYTVYIYVMTTVQSIYMSWVYI